MYFVAQLQQAQQTRQQCAKRMLKAVMVMVVTMVEMLLTMMPASPQRQVAQQRQCQLVRW
jgi:hypothetical protein